MKPEQEMTVIARDFTGKLKKSWNCRKLNSVDSTLTLCGEFIEDITHSELGLIQAGTLSYEFFFPDRWYNIFRFEYPAAVLRNWYCNITMPPLISQNTVEYVDLDIDVLIWPDRSLKILDVEEYEENIAKYCLSETVQKNVSIALTDLVSMFRQNKFPFNIRHIGEMTQLC